MLKRFIFAMPIAAILSTSAFAATDAECSAMWTKSDVQTGGKLTPTYAQSYTKSGRVLAADGMIDEAAFMQACKADAFTTMVVATAPEAGAPFPGANSFTETQAMDRIQKSGFTGVSALKKDADGIWRGTAMKNDKSVSVALDFKGNVVAK